MLPEHPSTRSTTSRGLDDEAFDEIAAEGELVAQVDDASGEVAFEVMQGDVAGRADLPGSGELDDSDKYVFTAGPAMRDRYATRPPAPVRDE